MLDGTEHPRHGTRCSQRRLDRAFKKDVDPSGLDIDRDRLER
jgi:hypothetical protein